MRDRAVGAYEPTVGEKVEAAARVVEGVGVDVSGEGRSQRAGGAADEELAASAGARVDAAARPAEWILAACDLSFAPAQRCEVEPWRAASIGEGERMWPEHDRADLVGDREAAARAP